MATQRGWRTIDIVVAAVIAVAFGAVFQMWNIIWAGSEGPFTFFPPAQAVIYGVWLLPAVLAGLIIRKPGAAFFTETVAAAISLLLGSPYGGMVIVQGAIEGLAAELGFAAFGYRSFRAWVAALAGATGGLGATLFDIFYWYPDTELIAFRVPYVAIGVVSCAVVGGLGSYAIVGRLAQTGVLDRFPAGRDRVAVS